MAMVPHLGRFPLVLAPSDPTGWFGGTSLVARDPVVRDVDVSLATAAAALEREFTSGGTGLTAALVRYDGTAEVRVYEDVRADEVTAPAYRGGALLDEVRFDVDEAGWVERVRDVQERIRAGEVYVLNLTMRVTGAARTSPSSAFGTLLARAGAPMAALWGAPSESVVSASPERFLEVMLEAAGRRVEVWPIKGTAPRDADDATDRANAEALRTSEKERAEHVMIVDLERNDLGRSCEPGTIAADPVMEVFAMPYCHQMVSRVSGRMRQDADFAGLLGAAFPCGSVTGAPKVAAMRAIRELESGPRGAYTGALLVAMRGRMDSSVLIRTLEYLPGGDAVWGAGCGITIDSDPAEEWREALLKASPVLG